MHTTVASPHGWASDQKRCRTGWRELPRGKLHDIKDILCKRRPLGGVWSFTESWWLLKVWGLWMYAKQAAMLDSSDLSNQVKTTFSTVTDSYSSCTNLLFHTSRSRYKFFSKLWHCKIPTRQCESHQWGNAWKPRQRDSVEEPLLFHQWTLWLGNQLSVLNWRFTARRKVEGSWPNKLGGG